MPAKPGSKLDISDAERQRRSELAKQLHGKRDPVTGRPLFGGKQPGAGRPRKRRATEVINEKIEAHADEIWGRLLEVMRQKKSDQNALMAVKQMMEITNKETDIQAREEKSLEGTPTDELVEIVASRLARLAESGALPVDITISDADVVEDRSIGTTELEEDGSEGSSSSGEPDRGSGTSPFARRTAD
jgi:preprotein translocase subunit SecD